MRKTKAFYSTDSDYSTLDASSVMQYVLLFGESVPYLARTLRRAVSQPICSLGSSRVRRNEDRQVTYYGRRSGDVVEARGRKSEK